MQELVSPDRLTDWVPGQVLNCSAGLNWRNVGLRTYHYQGQDVIVPALTDFMLVSYRSGVTPMQRRFEGAWKKDTLAPGAISLLTRAQMAHWTWVEPLVVTHLYLSPALLAGIASEAMDCHVASVELADVLRIDDPLLTSMVDTIASEASQKAMGGALYVESLSRAIGVHLLRRYATIRLPPAREPQQLSPTQMRQIRDFIEDNLAEPLSLENMAQQLGLATDLFARRFRASFGHPPYRHVMQRRVDRAMRLLTEGRLAVKEIAACCGFADQAHLTRIYMRETGTTPAAFRKSV